MKKALFTLGTLAAVATPIAAVVSCGSTTPTISKTESTKISVGDQEFLTHQNTKTGAKNLKEVADYLNSQLSLKPFDQMKVSPTSTYGFQAFTRWGDVEMEEYNMDNGWKASYPELAKKYNWTPADDWKSEYMSQTGWKRLNGDYQVFESIYPAFKSDFDYSNGADFKFDFVITESKMGDGNAFWAPLKTADGKDSVPLTFNQLSTQIKGYNVSTVTDDKLAKTKEAIINLSNMYALLNDQDKAIMLPYFDKPTWTSFKDVLTSPKVQEYIKTHIDSIYDAFCKYPATDVTAFATPGSFGDLSEALKAPTSSNLSLMLFDDFTPQKRTLILGVKLLEYIIDQAHIQ